MTDQVFILPAQKHALLAFLDRLNGQWKVTVKAYKRDRSVEQNAVCHGWYAEISRKLGEDTPEGVKRFCKLEFGIPILRNDPEFNYFYNTALTGLTYEQQLDAMKFLDVTSLMNTSEMLEYMTAIQGAYADRLVLRYPNDPPEFDA